MKQRRHEKREGSGKYYLLVIGTKYKKYCIFNRRAKEEYGSNEISQRVCGNKDNH